MVNSEEGEFEPIDDAGLVVDGTEIVFDDLFRGFEARGDFAILAALNNESYDAHLLGCESVADAASDEIFFRCLGDHQLGRHPGISGGYATDALDQRVATDIAEDHPAKTELQVARGGVRVFCDDDPAATGRLQELAHAGHVGPQRGGKQDDGAWKGCDRVEKTLEIGALRNDPQFVMSGQHLCSAGAEYSL